MIAITVSRQLGSGGATVARLVAGELGFRVLDRELVDAVAARAGVSPETAQALDEQAYGWASGLIHSFLLALRGQQFDQESYHYIADRLIREAAGRENLVILGRAGQVVLGFRPGTFHVHVVAPIEDRVARVAARDRIGVEEARAKIADSDEARRRYVYAAGQRDWSDPVLYDLVLNTHRLAPEAAAALVVNAARQAGVVR